jgi:hypothetical protein
MSAFFLRVSAFNDEAAGHSRFPGPATRRPDRNRPESGRDAQSGERTREGFADTLHRHGVIKLLM